MFSCVRRDPGLCSSFSGLLIVALAVLALGGCASGAFNSNPKCKDCDKYLGPPPVVADAEEDPCQHPVPHVETGRQFENLVFEGGGVKGTAYVGVLEVLDKAEILGSIDHVAGTSAGAITSLMVALGLKTDEVRHLALDVLDFRKFEDGSCLLGNASRVIHRYGWFKGDYFLCFVECLIARHLDGNPRATFADLAAKVEHRKDGDPHYRYLRVFGTNVTTNRSVMFSAETHPDMALADAVRISMSIPYFFAAREATIDGKPDVFVDGGVLRNYPLDTYDGPEGPNPATLGFHLGTAPEGRNDTSSFSAFGRQMLSTTLDVQVDALCNRPDDVRRTVFVDPGDIGTTDFDITREQKCQLIAAGIEATASYLNNGPGDTCPVWLHELLRSRRQ